MMRDAVFWAIFLTAIAVGAACFLPLLYEKPHAVWETPEPEAPERIVYRDRLIPCDCQAKEKVLTLPSPQPKAEPQTFSKPVLGMVEALQDPALTDAVTGMSGLEQAVMAAVRKRTTKLTAIQLGDRAQCQAHADKIIQAVDATVGESRRRVIADRLYAELQEFGGDHLAYSQKYPVRQWLAGALLWERLLQEHR